MSTLKKDDLFTMYTFHVPMFFKLCIIWLFEIFYEEKKDLLVTRDCLGSENVRNTWTISFLCNQKL